MLFRKFNKVQKLIESFHAGKYDDGSLGKTGFKGI